MENFKTLIEEKIKEHEEQGHCIDYDKTTEILAQDTESGFNSAYDVGRYEVLLELLRELKELDEHISRGYERVRVKYLDIDKMEMLNRTTGLSDFATDNWVDKSEILYIEEDILKGDDTKKNIREFISDDDDKAIMNNEIDFIAFRIDN